MTSKIKLSTGMLCFSRSLQIGEGMLFARNSAHPETTYPVPVYRKGVRGDRKSVV